MNDKKHEPRDRSHGFAAWFDARFRSATAVYGLIVYMAFITISADEAEHPVEMLFDSAVSIIVFFIAHVFAHTLTDHGDMRLSHAIHNAVRHASGMLYTSALPAIVLIGGALTSSPVDDTYEGAVWVSIILLAILGYIAYSKRGSHVLIRLVGAVGTAALGWMIVVLEWLIH